MKFGAPVESVMSIQGYKNAGTCRLEKRSQMGNNLGYDLKRPQDVYLKNLKLHARILTSA